MSFQCRFFLKILLSVFVGGFFYLLPAQSIVQSNKRKVFYDYYHDYQINHKNWEIDGNKMLENSQNSYEKSLSYLTLGQGKYEKGDFVKSVELLEEARIYAASADTLNLQADIYMTLIPAYRRAGLISQSNDGLQKVKKLTDKLNKEQKNFYLLYCEAKIFDIDKNFCKAAEKRREFSSQLKDVSEDKDVNNRYRFSVLNQLCYVELKCGDITRARKTFVEVERLFNNISKTTPIKLIEFYFMNKALFNVLDDNRNLALENFSNATNEALRSGNNIVTKELLMERLNANLDSPQDQLKFTKIVQSISESETTASKNLVYIETVKNKGELLEEARKAKIFVGIASFSVFLFVLGLVFYRFRSTQLKNKYLKIIQELEQSKLSNVLSNNVNFEEKDVPKSDIIKNEATEQEILKNLVAFEKKKLFTTKGIATAQMAVMLKTNTKYLNHVLKKYRNSDFYNYINDCRIDFIVSELHDNPQLRQYKIAVLSEMCGFSSHSQFTSIFKSKKGISPSHFIDFLQKDQS